MRIVVGLLIMAAGALIIIKTEWFLRNFGRIEWFENNFGSDGGTRLGYKLIGFIIIFIGILFLSGNAENFFLWMLSPLINAGAPSTN